MQRFGILGRLLLIFLSALLVLAVISLLLLRWQETHRPRSAPFLRVKATARTLDLLARSPPSAWPADLQAMSDRQVYFQTQDQPPRLDGLIHAPRLEARLRDAARTPTAAAARVYTSADQQHRDPQDGVEGFMTLATAQLPDGRYLVATPVFEPEHQPRPPLGLPPGIWIGLCGAAVAALAVFGAAHETRPLRTLTRSLNAFDGIKVAAVGNKRGAPDVRALTEAVNAMQRRVAGLMSERTVMMGAVSHDLRTFLTRLQLRLLTLDDGALRARLEGDVEAMRALVEDALAYARGSEGALRHQRLDLADLVASEIAEREALGATPAIEADLSDAFVLGDAAALRRMVANLLDNAAKFGRTRVRVTVARPNNRVQLSVEDDGPGVPLADRAAVLLPFHRLEGSRSRETGGVGLGLAIANRIVRAHGGELAIRDSDIGGANACVSLPGVV